MICGTQNRRSGHSCAPAAGQPRRQATARLDPVSRSFPEERLTVGAGAAPSLPPRGAEGQVPAAGRQPGGVVPT